MITVGAGDNVVRLLPRRCIVTEDEIAEAVVRIERACTRIARGREKTPQKGAVA